MRTDIVCAAALISVVFAMAALPASAKKPNIVMILTDDQDYLMGYSSMPKTRKILLEGGMTLDSTYGSTPVCCPSRGGMQTGRYIHNVPMKNNSLAGNCSGPAWRAGAEKENFAVYLKKAGYTTFYGGKYLNTYGTKNDGGVGLVPPGWDDWQGLVGNSIYYNYEMSNNGQLEKHGNDVQKDYLPKVLQRKAMAFLENATSDAKEQPFFLMLGTPSCHDPTEPAVEYKDDLPGATAPRPPNYAAFFEDKHWFVQRQSNVSGFNNGYAPIEESYNDLQYRRRALTLKTVDDIIGNITQLLENKGLLENTYIFHTADNGYHLGQFAMLKDKRQPYEFDIHLPGAVRGPGIKPNSTLKDIVTLVDFAPTFLDIAGADIPPQMDGLSMLPALHNNGELRKPLRVDYLVEYHGEGLPEHAPSGPCKAPNMFCGYVGPEMNNHPPEWNRDPVCSCQDSHNNTFACVRTFEPFEGGRDWTYCEFFTAEGQEYYREFYNVTRDVWQRTNEINNVDPAIIKAQHERLEELRACSGASCRTQPAGTPEIWL